MDKRTVKIQKADSRGHCWRNICSWVFFWKQPTLGLKLASWNLFTYNYIARELFFARNTKLIAYLSLNIELNILQLIIQKTYWVIIILLNMLFLVFINTSEMCSSLAYLFCEQWDSIKLDLIEYELFSICRFIRMYCVLVLVC